MTTIANVTAEFDKMVPAIAEDYTGWVTRQLTRLIALEPKALRQLASSWGYDGGLWRQLRRYCTMVDQDGQPTNRFTDRYVINHDYLAAQATKYAQYQVDSFKAKLEAKLVGMTDIEDLEIRGLEFAFHGKVGSNKVMVEQTTILKCSNRGKLFNQWPCRIYVNGKMMPEAKFKKLIA